MAEEPRKISIDLGYCPGWTLQRGKADSAEFIRCLDDAEFEKIKAAVMFCREYVLHPPSRLLISSYQIWRNIIARVAEQATGRLPFELSNELQSAFVGWLLIWRLVLDQADHNICRRFGKESNERLLLGQARRDAFDTHQGYRVVEAMRNLVQHREMPPFNLSRNRQLDRQSGQVLKNIRVVFPVSWLLESSKCAAKIKSEFKNNSSEMLSMIDVVDDAMSGFHEVFLSLVKINHPETLYSINLLRQIFGEAYPGLPVVLRAKRPEAGAIIRGGVQFELHPIEDLLKVVQEAPVGRPYQPDGQH